jgi:uncharacterized protein (UPF0333 family)
MLSAYSRQAQLGYLLAVSAVVVAVGTFSAYILESDIPDSRIRDLGDAFWWALATVTTVGYGDVVPVTALGRAVGAVLMVSGIAILSVFISSLGAFLIKTAATPKTLTDEVKETIKKKIDNIENLTQGRSRGTTPDDQGPEREETHLDTGFWVRLHASSDRALGPRGEAFHGLFLALLRKPEMV